MSALTAALGALLRDPNMSAAVILVGNVGIVETRGLVRKPDEIVDVLGSRVIAETRLLEVMASDAEQAGIVDGSTVEIDGVSHVVTAPPRADRDRLMVLLEVAPK